MKSTLYLETTIPSYLTARQSRDIIVLAHQQITQEWWEVRRMHYEIYISPVVINEIQLGDNKAAEQRLHIIKDIEILAATQEVEEVTELYLAELSLPKKAIRDATHLAFACVYGLDFLLTWNCTHIANAEIRKKLNEINAKHEILTPIICTPEELMGFKRGV